MVLDSDNPLTHPSSVVMFSFGNFFLFPHHPLHFGVRLLCRDPCLVEPQASVRRLSEYVPTTTRHASSLRRCGRSTGGTPRRWPCRSASSRGSATTS